MRLRPSAERPDRRFFKFRPNARSAPCPRFSGSELAGASTSQQVKRVVALGARGVTLRTRRRRPAPVNTLPADAPAPAWI